MMSKFFLPPLASVFGLGILRSTMAFHPISPRIIQRCWLKPGLRIVKSHHNKLFSTSSSPSSVPGIAVGVGARDNLLGFSESDTNSLSNSTHNNEPVCRIVATSDGKISPSSALASLSSSSRSLLDKIELVYTVESQKQLRDLTYMKPLSTLGSIQNTQVGMDERSDADHEERLVSILKQSLKDGGYKLMSKRDLDLCSALNAGYLLRLSLLPDVKELDSCIGRAFYPEMYEEFVDTGTKDGVKGDTTSIANQLLFDGKVLVFRRGYSKEITSGRLLLPKLDYLQASLVQRSSSALTRKLGDFEKRLENYFLEFISGVRNSILNAFGNLLRQLRDVSRGTLRNSGHSLNSVENAMENGENRTLTTSSNDNANATVFSSVGTRGNKVFKFSRYQASSTMMTNSFDLHDILSPFLLCDIVNNTRCTDDTNGMVKNRRILCQYDNEIPSEANSFSLLERISIQNTVDFFTTKGRRELIRNFFKSSTLVEPAFAEVIVISKPTRKKEPKTIDLRPPGWLYEVAKVFDVEDRLPNPKNKTKDNAPNMPIPIDIKVFSDVPMANIEAVMPKSKLIFRPADAVVFDLVSVVSFIAVVGSLRFDSPKLDLIALISLIVFVAQTFFRYSNKYARYDLIVNKFITSKVLHRGPGALKYIVSEANSNRALRSVIIPVSLVLLFISFILLLFGSKFRAMLTRDWLINNSNDLRIEAIDDDAVGKAKSHINAMLSTGGSQIDIDLRSALVDLNELQLINSTEVKNGQAATDVIKHRWNALLCD